MVDRKGTEAAVKEEQIKSQKSSTAQTKSFKGDESPSDSFHAKAEKGKDIKIVKNLVGDKMGSPASPMELFFRKCQGDVFCAFSKMRQRHSD
jgi:hypothetical protein